MIIAYMSTWNSLYNKVAYIKISLCFASFFPQKTWGAKMFFPNKIIFNVIYLRYKKGKASMDLKEKSESF